MKEGVGKPRRFPEPLYFVVVSPRHTDVNELRKTFAEKEGHPPEPIALHPNIPRLYSVPRASGPFTNGAFDLVEVHAVVARTGSHEQIRD